MLFFDFDFFLYVLANTPTQLLRTIFNESSNKDGVGGKNPKIN